jgi:hypothetical protein
LFDPLTLAEMNPLAAAVLGNVFDAADSKALSVKADLVD